MLIDSIWDLCVYVLLLLCNHVMSYKYIILYFLLGTKFDILAFKSKDQLIDIVMPLMIEPT